MTEVLGADITADAQWRRRSASLFPYFTLVAPKAHAYRLPA